MKSVFFTKPKSLTLAMLEHMVDSGDEVAGVVLFGKSVYSETPFAAYCAKEGIQLLDYCECDDYFDGVALDAIWCCTFPRLVKQEWIASARFGAVNFHGAPLPEYRGVFAYNFAILNGEMEYGVTAHLMSETFDTGDVIEVDRFAYDCAKGSVSELVALSDAHQLEQFKKVRSSLIECGGFKAKPQDLHEGHYYSRADFENAKRILPEDDEATILRKIHAFWYPPYEGAWIELGGKRFYPVTLEMIKSLEGER